MKKVLVLLLSCFLICAAVLPAEAVTTSQSYTVAELPATPTTVCNIAMAASSLSRFILKYEPAAAADTAHLMVCYADREGFPTCGGESDFNKVNRVDLDGVSSFTVTCDEISLSVTTVMAINNNSTASNTVNLIVVDPNQYKGANVTVSDFWSASAVVPVETESGTTVTDTTEGTDTETFSDPGNTTIAGESTDAAQETEATTAETTTIIQEDPKDSSGSGMWKIMAVIGFSLATLFAAAAVALLVLEIKKVKELNTAKKNISDLQKKNADLQNQNEALQQSVVSFKIQESQREQEALRLKADAERERIARSQTPERSVSFLESIRNSVLSSYRDGTAFPFQHGTLLVDRAQSAMAGTPVLKDSSSGTAYFTVITAPDSGKQYLLPNPTVYNQKNCTFGLNNGDILSKCITARGREGNGAIVDFMPTVLEKNSAGEYNIKTCGWINWR